MNKPRSHSFWIFLIEGMLILSFTLVVSVGVLRYFNRCDIGVNTGTNFFSVFLFDAPIFFLVFSIITVILRVLLFRFLAISTFMRWFISIISKTIIAILLYAYVLYDLQEYPTPLC